MARLLIYEPSYRRVRAALARFGDAIEPLVVDREGAISLAGEAVSAEDAQPEIAWFSGDLYQQKAAGPFVQAMLASENLKWFHSAAAGFDHPMFQRVAAKGVRFTTSHGQAVGMAEYVLAGVLDAFQRGADRRAAQQARDWSRLVFREVMGSRWLIFGFGAIGQAVAERARAFGARIVGVRRAVAPHPLAETIIAQADVLAHLPDADVVVLCAPISGTTRHVADGAFFAAMKEGSVIVNVGRGALIDEAALLAALDRGRPAHAVLDVFATEPLPADSPFWAHPRVSLTSHASGNTDGEDRRNEELFVDNFVRYLDGKPLLNEAVAGDVLAG